METQPRLGNFNDVSRATKTSGNDADRLRKYLARFGLKFEDLSSTPAPG
jgi:transcriptional regulatory protein RtcR